MTRTQIRAPAAAIRRHRNLMSLGPMLCLLAGCSPSAPGPGAAAAGALPRLQEIGSVGCLDCEGIQQLTPQGVALSSTRLFVVDAFEPLIRIFDIDGEDPVGFGRLGQGPGELQMAVAALPLDDDDLLVYDLMGVREFTAAGQYLRTMRWSPKLPHSFDFRASTRDLLMVASPPPGQTVEVADRVSLIAWHLDSADLEPHVLLPMGTLPRDDTDPDEAASRAVAADPNGGFVVGERWGYQLVRYDESGDLVQRTGRDLPRPHKTAEELEAAQRLDREFRANGIDPGPVIEEKEHFSAYGIKVDGRGRIWVLTQRGDESSSQIDLFGADGAFLGEITVAGHVGTNYPLWDLEGDRVAGAVLGQDGNWVIRVWRIVEPS